MTERLGEAQRNAVALGDCLIALRKGDESDDARVGAIVIAEFINLVRSALKKK